MKSVAEYVFVETFVINFLIGKTTSCIAKEKTKILWLGASISAVVAIILQILKLKKIGVVLVGLCLNSLCVCISYKFASFSKYIRLVLYNILVLFLYCGAHYVFARLFDFDSFLIVDIAVFCVYLIVQK